MFVTQRTRKARYDSKNEKNSFPLYEPFNELFSVDSRRIIAGTYSRRTCGIFERFHDRLRISSTRSRDSLVRFECCLRSHGELGNEKSIVPWRYGRFCGGLCVSMDTWSVSRDIYGGSGNARSGVGHNGTEEKNPNDTWRSQAPNASLKNPYTTNVPFMNATRDSRLVSPVTRRRHCELPDKAVRRKRHAYTYRPFHFGKITVHRAPCFALTLKKQPKETGADPVKSS